MRDLSIVIKGAGEMASGIARSLFKANMARICMLEIDHPLCVRRTVSFCEAVFERQVEVEGVVATLVRNRAELAEVWGRKQIGIFVDPKWKVIGELKPDVVIDAVLAKRNLGTHKDEAPVVIGVGPGFSAPEMVHAVIESNRGPNLGRAIYRGASEPYSGVPALKAGFSYERVLRAPHAGMVRLIKSIGDPVKAGDVILYVGTTPVCAAIDGITRGVIREIQVGENEKVGDIEPTTDPSCCWTVSDKAKAIGDGVVEAIRNLISIRERYIRKEEGVRQWMLSARYARSREILV